MMLWLLFLLAMFLRNTGEITNKAFLKSVFLTIIFVVCSQVILINLTDDIKTRNKNYKRSASQQGRTLNWQLPKLNKLASLRKEYTFNNHFNFIMVMYRITLMLCFVQNLKFTFLNLMPQDKIVMKTILMVYVIDQFQFLDFINFDQPILYSTRDEILESMSKSQVQAKFVFIFATQLYLLAESREVFDADQLSPALLYSFVGFQLYQYDCLSVSHRI
jgi:hypothetical protein